MIYGIEKDLRKAMDNMFNYNKSFRGSEYHRMKIITLIAEIKIDLYYIANMSIKDLKDIEDVSINTLFINNTLDGLNTCIDELRDMNDKKCTNQVLNDIKFICGIAVDIIENYKNDTIGKSK